jgi:hypothetical protein
LIVNPISRQVVGVIAVTDDDGMTGRGTPGDSSGSEKVPTPNGRRHLNH